MIFYDVSAEYTLSQMIPAIIDKLDHLKRTGSDDEYSDGQRTAYVECLELIQKWEKSKFYNLNFHIETKYPI